METKGEARSGMEMWLHEPGETGTREDRQAAFVVSKVELFRASPEKKLSGDHSSYVSDFQSVHRFM